MNVQEEQVVFVVEDGGFRWIEKVGDDQWMLHTYITWLSIETNYNFDYIEAVGINILTCINLINSDAV